MLTWELVKDMIDFFIELFDLESIEFPRSLWPQDKVVGKPDLVVFSDGSVLAFGSVTYVHWLLEYWAALVMSKSKVAPKNWITVPRLELNGAVLDKRLREFIVGQIDLEFGNVFQLVDSSTVLGYVIKAELRETERLELGRNA